MEFIQLLYSNKYSFQLDARMDILSNTMQKICLYMVYVSDKGNKEVLSFVVSHPVVCASKQWPLGNLNDTFRWKWGPG